MPKRIERCRQPHSSWLDIDAAISGPMRLLHFSAFSGPERPAQTQLGRCQAPWGCLRRSPRRVQLVRQAVEASGAPSCASGSKRLGGCPLGPGFRVRAQPRRTEAPRDPQYVASFLRRSSDYFVS